MNIDVQFNMVQFMDLPTLRSFGDLSEHHAKFVANHLDAAYTLALKTYVVDVAGFRATMRMLGAVISGSFALAFILQNQGPTFLSGDLDLYVPNQYAFRFALYLMRVEGYRHVKTSRVPYGRMAAHDIVLCLAKGTKRVDVIPSSNDCSLYPLSHFWATHVMNYLSADTYCVAYPDLTFAHRAVLSPFQLIDLRYPSDYVISLITKYRARGFDFRIRSYAWTDLGLSSSCVGDAACPRVRRFFGDRFCMTGSVGKDMQDCGYDGMLPGKETSYWWRGGDACGGGCKHDPVVPERSRPEAGVFVMETLAVEL